MSDGVFPDLIRRRRNARWVAWGIAAFVVALYLFGFFVRRA